MNKPLLQKLRSYLDEGKPYQEAVRLLRGEGFSLLEIEDAKIALNNQSAQNKQESKINISAHPELAEDLLKVHSTMAETKVKEPTETNVMLPTGLEGGFYFRGITGNVYVLGIGAILIFLGVFLAIKYLSK